MISPSAVWKRLRHAFIGHSIVPHVQDRCSALLRTHQALLNEQVAILAEARKRLHAMTEQMEQMDQEQLVDHIRVMQSAQVQFQHALERTKLAFVDMPSLMQEWEEWLRMEDMPNQQSNTLQTSRKEMVQSELLTRGVRRATKTERAHTKGEELISPNTESISVTSVTVSRPPVTEFLEVDHLDEWNAFFGEEDISRDVLKHTPQTIEEVLFVTQQAHILKNQSAHQRMERRHNQRLTSSSQFSH